MSYAVPLLSSPIMASGQSIYMFLDNLMVMQPKLSVAAATTGSESAAASSSQDSMFVTGSDRGALDSIAQEGQQGLNKLSVIFSQAAAVINSPTASDNDKIAVWSVVTSDVAMFRYGDASTSQIASGMTDLEKAFYSATQNSPFMKTALAMSEATSLPAGASPLETALYNAAQDIRNSDDFTTVTYTDSVTAVTAQTSTGAAVTSTFTYGMTRNTITDAQLVPTFIDPTERAGEKLTTTETSSSRQVTSAAVVASSSQDTNSGASAATATVVASYRPFAVAQTAARTLEQEIAEELLGTGKKTQDKMADKTANTAPAVTAASSATVSKTTVSTATVA